MISYGVKAKPYNRGDLWAPGITIAFPIARRSIGDMMIKIGVRAGIAIGVRFGRALWTIEACGPEVWLVPDVYRSRHGLRFGWLIFAASIPFFKRKAASA